MDPQPTSPELSHNEIKEKEKLAGGKIYADKATLSAKFLPVVSKDLYLERICYLNSKYFLVKVVMKSFRHMKMIETYM